MQAARTGDQGKAKLAHSYLHPTWLMVKLGKVGIAATIFLGIFEVTPIRNFDFGNSGINGFRLSAQAIAPPRHSQRQSQNQKKTLTNSDSTSSTTASSAKQSVKSAALHKPTAESADAEVIAEPADTGQLIISMGLKLVTEEAIPNYYQNLIAEQLQLFWQRSIAGFYGFSFGSFSSLTKPKVAAAVPIAIPTANYTGFISKSIYNWEIAHSDFLLPIAKRSGLSAEATITVCRVYGSCRRMNGDRPMEDPASLIKVPVAVALLHKLEQQNISLYTKVTVDEGNFTEDRLGTISSGQAYTLKTLLTEMIASSSNIATNQLIDYLGHDYINEVLKQRGFASSEVNFKLMGDQIMPANPGTSSNKLTSDDLTRMMVQIYRQEHAGDQVLIKSLKMQRDRDLGFVGVKQAKAARWVGEKTGQTSRALGTTVALEIKGEQYVVTVVDTTGSDAAISEFVTLLANHISDRGHL
jgi:beta-lactamase class A